MENYLRQYSQRNSHTHLQAATSPRLDQSLQKSVSAQPKKEFQNIFSNASKKIKPPDTQATTNKFSDKLVQTIYRQRNLTRRTEAHAHNKGSYVYRP